MVEPHLFSIVDATNVNYDVELWEDFLYASAHDDGVLELACLQ